jgi:hypothetical protein
MGAARSNRDLDWSGSRATNTTPGGPSVEELVAFERMLADLSARMANVPAERVEPEIQLAQVILRQFLGFDRSTFAEFQDDSSLVVVSSTAIEGVDPTPLGPLPPQLDWFIAKLRAGQTLVIQDPADDLPPEAVGEAEYIQRTGLRSHLSIPLRIGGRVVGAIAFSAFRETRNWPEDLIARGPTGMIKNGFFSYGSKALVGVDDAIAASRSARLGFAAAPRSSTSSAHTGAFYRCCAATFSTAVRLVASAATTD